MKPWRCLNESCADSPGGRPGHDFDSDVPVCDVCGADGRAPEGRGVVIALEVVHLLYSEKGGKIRTAVGVRVLACQPESAKLPPRCTPETSAVTCPACKATAKFKELVERPDAAETGQKLLEQMVREGGRR